MSKRFFDLLFQLIVELEVFLIDPLGEGCSVRKILVCHVLSAVECKISEFLAVNNIY